MEKVNILLEKQGGGEDGNQVYMPFIRDGSEPPRVVMRNGGWIERAEGVEINPRFRLSAILKVRRRELSS